MGLYHFKMAAKLLAVLCIICLLIGSSHEVTQLCVKADDNILNDFYLENKDCDYSNPLSHFAEQAEKYSNSNTIVYFFGGRHTLGTIWEWRSVENITFKTDSGSKVLVNCSVHNKSGFIFRNVSMLSMSGLDLTDCGAHWIINSSLRELASNVTAALSFIYGSNIMLTNIGISFATAAGFYIYNVAGEVVLDTCSVSNAISTLEEFNNIMTGNIIVYDKELNATSFTLQHSLIYNSGHNFEKICSFNKHLSYSSGLSIFLGNENMTMNIFNTTFSNNRGCNGGNMALLFFSIPANSEDPMITIDTCTFENGGAFIGGGLYISFEDSFIKQTDNNHYCAHLNYSKAFRILNSIIKNNFGKKNSGGVYLQWKELLTLSCDRIYDTEIANSTFDNNKVGINGSGGLALHHRTYIESENEPHKLSKFRVNLILSNCNFSHHDPNLANGQRLSESSVILVKSVPFLRIDGVRIISNKCTAILAIDSILVFSASSEISNNTAINGAGIRLCSGALMYINPNTELFITNNMANHTGGGILVNSKCLVNVPMCFYQFTKGVTNNFTLLSTINISITGNSASTAGDNLYGGSIDYCYLLYVKRNDIKFYSLLDIPNNSISQPSSISSSPQHICFKGDSYCERQQNISIYPGEERSFKVQVVGQLDGAVPGEVLASTTGEVAVSYDDEVKTVDDAKGSVLRYKFYSSSSSIPTNDVTVTLNADTKEGSNTHMLVTNRQPAKISIKFNSCPLGFIMGNTSESGTKFKCGCNIVISYITKCSITTKSISKQKQSWIGMFHINDKPYLAGAKYCPLDYCNSDVDSIISADYSLQQDEQCRYNRRGILCGSCPNGWSLMLGNSQCQKNCSNVWLLLIIPFAVAGLLLVMVITFLNLTVTMGTVCGLIFYANIMQDYSITLLDSHPIPVLSSILKIFIAWLNLDLGIPTCFYDGMEAIGKTMLQAVFPVYIWLISAVIIILSNRYIFVTRLVGQNSVKVLATLILLSYSKMLRVTIGSLNSKFISVYVNDTIITKPRWILDGNIAYFDIKKHLIVVIIGMVFVILTLPFALALLCIRHFYSLSNWCKIFSWVNKLKPFFDTFTGPYKDNASFWTGLLLVVRLILLVVHTIDYEYFFTPYIISILIFFLLSAIMVAVNGIYKKHYLNILEYSFFLNIGIVFTVYVASENFEGIKVVTIYLSVIIAFLTFLGIIFFHIYLKLSGLKRIKGVPEHYEDFDVGSCDGMRGYESIEDSTDDVEGSDKMIHFPPIDNPNFYNYERSRSFSSSNNN